MNVNKENDPAPADVIDLAQLSSMLGGFDLSQFEADIDGMPSLPLQALTRQEDGMRPPGRAELASVAADSQLARLVESVRQEAEQGVSTVMAQAAQWLPASSTRAASASLQMGNVMELRDLMASSRRSLGGGENSGDERRNTARILSVASAVNLAQPLWDPAQASTYAPLDDPHGNNLLAGLLAL